MDTKHNANTVSKSSDEVITNDTGLEVLLPDEIEYANILLSVGGNFLQASAQHTEVLFGKIEVKGADMLPQVKAAYMNDCKKKTKAIAGSIADKFRAASKFTKKREPKEESAKSE